MKNEDKSMRYSRATHRSQRADSSTRGVPGAAAHPLRSVLRGLERLVEACVALALPLVLPLSFLLALQWPLRNVVQAYSTQANDLAQILFAFYVSVAITYATRRHGHLAADTLARHFRPALRERLFRAACLVVLVPWSLFVLVVDWPLVSGAVRQLESFPETYNPGYFLLKAAVALLSLLVLLQAVVDVARPGGAGRQPWEG